MEQANKLVHKPNGGITTNKPLSTDSLRLAAVWLDAMCSQYSKEVNPKQTELWAKMLSRYSSEEIDYAFERWMFTQKWMPQFSDISGLIEERRKQLSERAEEERERAVTAELQARKDAGEEFFTFESIVQDWKRLAKEKREQRERDYELKMNAAKKLARAQADVLIAKEKTQ